MDVLLFKLKPIFELNKLDQIYGFQKLKIESKINKLVPTLLFILVLLLMTYRRILQYLCTYNSVCMHWGAKAYKQRLKICLEKSGF